MYDLLVRGGTVISPTMQEKLDVAVVGEHVTAIGRPGALYLSFTGDALWDDERRSLLFNNYPTPKYQQDQDLLWQALADGCLQTVGSDHFATSVADHYEKMGTTVDRMQAGHANVELRLPVTFRLRVQQGRMSVNRFVEVVATEPARIMGLYPRRARSRSGVMPTSWCWIPTGLGPSIMRTCT